MRSVLPLLAGSVLSCGGDPAQTLTGPAPPTVVEPACTSLFDPADVIAETGDQLFVTIFGSAVCDWAAPWAGDAILHPVSSGGVTRGTNPDAINR